MWDRQKVFCGISLQSAELRRRTHTRPWMETKTRWQGKRCGGGTAGVQPVCCCVCHLVSVLVSDARTEREFMGIVAVSVQSNYFPTRLPAEPPTNQPTTRDALLSPLRRKFNTRSSLNPFVSRHLCTASHLSSRSVHFLLRNLQKSTKQTFCLFMQIIVISSHNPVFLQMHLKQR